MGTGGPAAHQRSLSPAKDGIAVVGFRLMRLDTLPGFHQALREELEHKAAADAAAALAAPPAPAP